MLTISRHESCERSTIKITINREKVGKIKHGETAEFRLSPGEHEVYITVLATNSPPVQIVYTGESVHLECRISSIMGFPELFYAEAPPETVNSQYPYPPGHQVNEVPRQALGRERELEKPAEPSSTDLSKPIAPRKPIGANSENRKNSSDAPYPEEPKDSKGKNTNWAWGLLLLPILPLFMSMDVVDNEELSPPASKATPETEGGSGTEETRTTTLGAVRFALECQRRNQTEYKIIAMDQARENGIIVHYGGSGADVGRSGVNPNFSHVDVSIDTHDMRYDFETYFPPNREYTYLVWDGPFYLRRRDSKFVDETSKEDWGVTNVYDCHKIASDRADKAIRDFWSAHGELERRKQREEQSELESREL